MPAFYSRGKKRNPPQSRRKRARRPMPHVRQFESLETRLPLTSGDALPELQFSLISEWQDGFQASINVHNDESTSIDDWAIGFDLDASIIQLWNGQVTQNGPQVEIEDAGWNALIEPGQTIEIGFLSDEAFTSPPTAMTFNSISLQGSTTPPTDSHEPTVPIVDAPTIDIPNETPEETPSSTEDATDETPLAVVPRDSPVDDELRNDAPTSPPDASNGAFNYGEVLQKSLYFYDAQRSGDLPNDFRVDWRDDSGLEDGADVGVDLTGGFYDAGDHVKFGFPMASTLTMLGWGLVEYPQAYELSGQLDAMRETMRWGADYIMRAHTAPNELWGQVGDGTLDHSFWGAAEVMTMDRPSHKIDENNPGSDLAGESAAALAATAIAFQATDPAYANELLSHARELYSFADQFRGAYSDSIPDAAQFYRSWSSYQDELVWGAIWLFKATGERAYLDKAESYYNSFLAGDKFEWTQNWDDKRYGSAVALADITGKQVYKQQAEDWLNYWTVGNRSGNRIDYSPGGLAHLDRWGSLRYSANTAFLAFVYSDNVNDVGNRYRDFAEQQINYMLGDNPNNRSYVVGFGNNPPVNPHHRSASGVWNNNVNSPIENRNVLYGALVGGPDSPDDDAYRDERDRYVDNEVALDYNAGFQGAIARLYLEYGGDPLDETIAFVQTPSDEILVEASVNNSGARFTEIRTLLKNQSHAPARASESLSFRYFVDLSEVYDAGYSVADSFVMANFTQGATVGNLQSWNAEEHIYFVEVDYSGVRLAPGSHNTFSKESQIRIGLQNHLPQNLWDPSNDWSYQGLRSGFNGLGVTKFVSVYDAGELVFGQEPDGSFSPASEPVPPAEPVVPPVVETPDPNPTPPTDDSGDGSPTETPSSETPSTETPTTNPPTVPTTHRPSDVELRIENEWNAGFVGYISVLNSSGETMLDWTVEFDLDAEIINLWNGNIRQTSTGSYLVRAADWNQLVGPNQEVAFGFQAVGSSGDGIRNVRLNGQPLLSETPITSSVDEVLQNLSTADPIQAPLTARLRSGRFA